MGRAKRPGASGNALTRRLLAGLSAAAGGQRLVSVDRDVLSRYRRDCSDRDLGMGLAVAAPGGHGAVASLVRWARKNRVALTPAGAATSCWASTGAAGRLIIDTRRMNRVVAFDPSERIVTVEGGISVAALDAWLRKRGLRLPVCPDGFGRATAASLVSNDTTAGHRALLGPASRYLVGVKLVTGNGDTLKTGASSVLRGLPRFMRGGLPDLTGPLLAAEGALGIITEVSLRAQPIPLVKSLQVRYRPSSANFERISSLARALRLSGACQSIISKSRCAKPVETTEIQIVSALCEEELSVRCRWIEAELRKLGLGEYRYAPESRPFWEPPIDDGRRLKGVCIDVPYGRGGAAYAVWLRRLRPELEALTGDDGDAAALSVYFHPDAMAFALGWNHDEAAEERSRRLMRAARRHWGPLGVPYRIGRAWRLECRGRIDGAYLRYMGGLKKLFDKDGIMNPQVGVFGLKPAARGRR